MASSSSAAARDALAKLKPEAAVKELSKKKSNKQCFDCGRSGPQQNVNSTLGTFVCTQCAGIHRKFNHKIKTINMSTFTPAEVDALANSGNKRARKVWLASFEEGKSFALDPEDPANVERFMHQVYIDKRWAKRDGAPDDDEDKKKKDKKAAKDDKPKRAAASGADAFGEAHFPDSIAVTHTAPAPAAAAPASKPAAPATDLGLDFLSNLTVSSPVKKQPPSGGDAFGSSSFGFDSPAQPAVSGSASSGAGLFDSPMLSASSSNGTAAPPAAVAAMVAALRSVQSTHGLSATQMGEVVQAALVQLSSGADSARSAASSPQSVNSSVTSPPAQSPQPHAVLAAAPPSRAAVVDVFADIAPAEDDHPTGGDNGGDAGDSGNPFDSDSDDDDVVSTRSPASSIGGGAYPQGSPISPQQQGVISPQPQQQQGVMSPQQMAAMQAAAAQGQLSPQQAAAFQQYQQQALYQQQMMFQQQMMQQQQHQQQQQQYGHQGGAFGQQPQMQQQQQQPGAFGAFGQQAAFAQQQQQQHPHQQAGGQQQQATSPTFTVSAAAPPAQPPAPAKPDLFAGFASFS